MTTEELKAEIATHDELIDYHLANAKCASRSGSMLIAENNIMLAAAHSSIATALRRRVPVETSRGEQIILAVLKGNRKHVREILGIGGQK